MRTHVKPVIVLYVLLAAISVIAIDLRLLLVPAAALSLVLFFAGLLVFRHFRGGFTIPWLAANYVEAGGFIVIDGKPCPFEPYDQEILVTVRVRRLPELIASAVLAGSTLYVLLSPTMSVQRLSVQNLDFFEIEFICFAGLAVVLANVSWFMERKFLKRCYHAIGLITSKNAGFSWRGISYQFFDHAGDRRGGLARLVSTGNDNGLLVLYDPADPDRSTPHGAFRFHKFTFHPRPASNR